MLPLTVFRPICGTSEPFHPPRSSRTDSHPDTHIPCLLCHARFKIRVNTWQSYTCGKLLWFPPALLCILHAGGPLLICLIIYEPRSWLSYYECFCIGKVRNSQDVILQSYWCSPYHKHSSAKAGLLNHLAAFFWTPLGYMRFWSYLSGGNWQGAIKEAKHEKPPHIPVQISEIS